MKKFIATGCILACSVTPVLADDHGAASTGNGAFTTLFVSAKDVEGYINSVKSSTTLFEAIGSDAAGYCETISGRDEVGQRDISFTMDLVKKDIGLFQAIAERNNVPLEISPLICEIFEDGIARYGERELSPNIIRRLEDATGLDIRAPGFPAEMTDDEPEELGYEVVPTGLHSST